MNVKPIHRYNSGRGATLCNKCHAIISEGMTDDLYCEACHPGDKLIKDIEPDPGTKHIMFKENE